MDDLHASLHPGYFRRGNPRTRHQLERILRAPDEVLRVAEDVMGPIVGLCHVQVYDTPPLPWMTPARRAHVDSLIVDAAERRRGIGRQLMDDATAWARARGAGEIVLTVWAGNTEAERFYESLGFGAVNSVLGRNL